jgi:uncharacterized RDD family membrane protein YckC
MEYIKCGTLAERVANGPLPVEDALQLVHDAALGLREAHHAGFSHRDVKPSNLMVDGHGVVKVVDFGLVAVAPEAAAPDAPAAQTSFGGTPLYMAPEQARGEPIDLRADIYALGATLYHLVAGKPPFVADTVPELLTLHRTAARPSVPRKGHAKSSASAVDALVAKMMAPDPADRFASYDELLRALELASAAHTRPAGFWVRGAATAVDFTFIFAIVAAACAASGRSEVPVATYGISGLALLQLIGMLWRGTTPGKVVFELEVIDVATGRPPRPGAALARTLALYGGVVIAGWLPHLVAMPKWMESLLDFVTYGLPLFALVRASLRVAGKRTPWDRIAGTIVHYKTARQLATS